MYDRLVVKRSWGKRKGERGGGGGGGCNGNLAEKTAGEIGECDCGGGFLT